MEIIASTLNRDKIKEINAITEKLGMPVISRSDAGIPDFDIEEDGETFEENSYKKAYEIMKICGRITIADDSGLMVDALDGAPGVYSARYAGEHGTYKDNNQKLLKALADVPDEKRTAQFVSVITMVYPDGSRLVARGECKGHILREERGKDGFGYDPLFVPEGHEKTFSEMTPEEKNAVSHRAKALQALAELLRGQTA